MVELTLVAGLLGGVSLVVMNLMNQSTKSSVKYQFDSEVNLSTNELNAILSDPLKCVAALGSTASPTNINGKYYISTDPAGGGGYGNANIKINSYVFTSSGNDGLLSILFENKNILKGTTGPATVLRTIKLYVEGTPGAITNCRSLSSSSTDIWSHGTGSDIFYSGGNVGVGTNNPETSVHITSTSSSNNAALLIAAPAGDDASIQLISDLTPELEFNNQARNKFAKLTYNNGNLFLNMQGGRSTFFNQNGNLGLGVADPRAVLDVSDDILLSRYTSGAPTAYIWIDPDDDGPVGDAMIRSDRSFGISTINNRPLNLGTNGTIRLGVSGAGNVSVGDNYVGTYKLDVMGDINSSSRLRIAGTEVCTVTGCTSSSDLRLKENIVPLRDSLEYILLLRGISYDYKNKAKFGDNNQVGLIAQEVELVYPQVVKTDPLTGLKSVAYGHLVAPLIEAVKSLHKHFTGLKQTQDDLFQKLRNENMYLKKENEEIKIRLEKIEKMLK